MKVFVVQAALNRSSEPYSQWLTDHDDKDVSVITQRQVQALQDARVTVKLGLLYSRTSLRYIFRDIRRLRREVKQFAPDVVHAHYGAMVGLLGWFVARSQSPFVVSYCGDDLEGTPLPGIKWTVRSYLNQRISLLVAKKSNAIIVKSQSLLMRLPKRLHNKCVVLPNGVDINFFVPHESSLNKRKSVDSMSVFFNASSGLNQSVKNLSLANKVIELLQLQGRRVKLVMAGTLSAEEFRNQLQAASCLLVTSKHEGSPNVVKEALACNIPVVSTDCGDVSQRLSGTSLGGVYAATPEALAAGVATVLDSQVIFNGRDELIKQGLDNASITRRLIKLYTDVQLS